MLGQCEAMSEQGDMRKESVRFMSVKSVMAALDGDTDIPF